MKIKISEKVDHFNSRSWFELYELESGEVLHEAESLEECEQRKFLNKDIKHDR